MQDPSFQWASGSTDANALAEYAQRLYGPISDEPADPQADSARLAHELASRMLARSNELKTDEERIAALGSAVVDLLRTERLHPSARFSHLAYLAALRPIRRLKLAIAVDEIIASMISFHRGEWVSHLERHEAYALKTGIAQALADLPTESLTDFWRLLQKGTPMERNAMTIGLAQLRSGRATPHLLSGLLESADHVIRAAIVDCLEQIGDPKSLPEMSRLRRETAYTDWPLSRHLDRAIRVIEKRSEEDEARKLLRPAKEVDPDPEGLLHVPAERPADPTQLLHVHPESKNAPAQSDDQQRNP